VLCTKPLRNLPCILIRTLHESNWPRRKHI
jgi:hypothetical protein